MIFIALYLTLLFIAPQLWVPPLTGVRVDFFLYPAWLLYVVARGRLIQLLRFRTQDWFFFGFVFWSALTVLASGISDEGVGIIFNLAKWFVLYRLTVASIGDSRGVRQSANLLVLFAMVLAVEGIHHYWSADGLGWAGQSLDWFNEAAAEVGLDRGRTRWIGIFDGPGVFCVAYTIALPFVLQYLAPPFGWVQRLVALVPTGLLLLAIYYNGSRGGWITAFLLIAASVAARSGLSPRNVAAVGTLGVLLAVTGPAYLTSIRDSSRSAQHRVEMWAEGIEMVQQNPVFGIGRGRFREYTGRIDAHNSAVEIMGEAGVLGLFLWAAISYSAFKTLLAAMRTMDNARDRTYARSLILSIAGYLVSAMFVTLEYETLYFLLGLAAAAGQSLEEPLSFGARDAGIVLFIIGAFFVVLKAFVMIYFA